MPELRDIPLYPLVPRKHSCEWVTTDRVTLPEEFPSYVFFDSVCLPFFVGRMPAEDYGIVRATEENISLALSKCDYPVVHELDPECEDMAQLYLSAHFDFMHGRFRKRHLNQVSIVPDASAGFPLQMSKGEAITKYHEYYSYFVTPGIYRHFAIFKVTPKVEYLRMDEILAWKIRLFRNPPLEYLLLEKVYFEEQDEFLVSHPLKCWSALGFVKEYGGWHHAMKRLEPFRFKVRWDVKFWDKRTSPPLQAKATKERMNWFHSMQALDPEDLAYLDEDAHYRYEILPNGVIIATGLSITSGRLRTSTDNTICHIFILFYHILRVSKKYNWNVDYDQIIEETIALVYSDDCQLATNRPLLWQEEELRHTFQLFGLDVQDYHISEEMESIHFLGATNYVWGSGTQKLYVPLYDEKRMIFSSLYVAGALTDVERSQRISGLAHNLAFSEQYGPMMVDLCHYLDSLGRWVGTPILELGALRAAYYPRPPAWVSRSVLQCRRLEDSIVQKRRKQLVVFLYIMQEDRKGRRSLNALEKLEKFNLLTPPGKAWLITAIDPFHDVDVDLQGFPDLDVAGSIVQCVKKTMQVSCPAALLASSSWDCHLVAWPLGKKQGGVPATQYDGFIISTSSPALAAYDIGGVTALATSTGNPTYGNGTAGGATGITNVTSTDTTASTGTYMDGTCRVVGYGFEVVNTTAALYKQGQVTVYRLPTPSKESLHGNVYGNVTAGFNSEGNFSEWDLPSPPSTPAEAMLLEGSRQWNAEEGSYQVCSLNSLNNYPDEPDAVMVVVQDTPDVQDNTGTNAVVVNGFKNRTLGATTIKEPTESQRFPFNISGAYYAGLSPQTTLTVNVNWFIERFPTPKEYDLVVLSKPSAGWDELSLNMYAAALRDMPAGVRLSENPLGEWFQDVVHSIAQNAGPVANALSVINPGFGIAGQLAGVIAKATERKKDSGNSNPVVLRSNTPSSPVRNSVTLKPKSAKAKQKSSLKTGK